MARKIDGEDLASRELKLLKSRELKLWLGQRGQSRRLFPQQLYHLVLAEAGIGDGTGSEARRQSLLFHLGQLSSLITGIETPGWVETSQFNNQVRALAMWGAGNARVEEAPLLVQPEAVTITTIHCKGHGVCRSLRSRRRLAKIPESVRPAGRLVAYDGEAAVVADPGLLADNDNLDAERRLLYVALTRAERFLFVTSSNPSPFFRKLRPLFEAAGAAAETEKALVDLNMPRSDTTRICDSSRHSPTCATTLNAHTTISSGRCSGFAPTIDQAFGYGRAVHNLMREVHSHPAEWAALTTARSGAKET